MALLEALVAGLTFVSLLILASNFLLTYVSFRSAMHGDAASREQTMRERYNYNSKTQKQEIYSEHEFHQSEPRVRDYGFAEWLKFLLPGREYPGFTHFNISIRHTDWPDLGKMAGMEDKYRPTFRYPDREELLTNEKLEQLDIIQVETLKEPTWEGNGLFIIHPVISYRIYVDSADPDRIEVIQESMRKIIIEIERGEEIIDLVEPIKTQDEINDATPINDEMRPANGSTNDDSVEGSNSRRGMTAETDEERG